MNNLIHVSRTANVTVIQATITTFTKSNSWKRKKINLS